MIRMMFTKVTHSRVRQAPRMTTLACPQYYVHKRYALPCQMWFRGVEL
jgi:hypothetical protein